MYSMSTSRGGAGGPPTHGHPRPPAPQGGGAGGVAPPGAPAPLLGGGGAAPLGPPAPHPRPPNPLGPLGSLGEGLVHGALRHKPTNNLRGSGGSVHFLVALHVLLAAEPLATDVAVVEGSWVVAPLVDVEVVGLGEGPVAQPAVVGLGHRAHLFLASEGHDPSLVHIDAQTDREHPRTFNSTLL